MVWHSQVGIEVMGRRFPFGLSLKKAPRFVSFDAGVVAGLLGIGVYMAISNRNWTAAVFLFLGALWMALIPFRLRRVAKSGDPGKR
jgi:hypothetical protein